MSLSDKEWAEIIRIRDKVHDLGEAMTPVVLWADRAKEMDQELKLVEKRLTVMETRLHAALWILGGAMPIVMILVSQVLIPTIMKLFQR